MAVYPRTGDTEVPAQPSFPALEREVLEYWDAHDTFRESIRQRPADDEFVFYDGPPFANGLPHYGHLITGYVKDLVPRFRTMQGKRVERRFGWDTHGLPAEVEAERILGISGKADIVAMGIEKFNQACRESVLRYTREWRDYVTRQARWVDFDHDYKTLDLPYMESVMWAFRQLWDKGLIYQGFKVLPYCWRCETPLSNHELRMDEDTYRRAAGPVGHGPVQAGDRGVAAGLDHHAVDAAVQPGLRGRRGHRVRGPGEGRRAVHPGPGPAGRLRARARGRRRGRDADRRRAGRAAVRAAAALPGGRRDASAPRTRSGSSCRTTSPPRTAPGWCTWRPPTARPTPRAAPRPASRPCSRWTSRPGSPPWCPTSRASTSSTPTPGSRPGCASRAAWSASRPTPTPTRTAGGAVTR